MSAQLPVLAVLVPMAAAPLCGLLGRPARAWVFAGGACVLTLAVSLSVLISALAGADLGYALGAWPAPWGIELRPDLLSAFLMVLVSAMASLALLASSASIAADMHAARQPFFYMAFLLCVAGFQGILATGDLFNLFVFLEISALSSYVLIALGRERRALWAAYQYLIMGTVGATFLLIGIGLLYMVTGTLNMADMAQRLPSAAGARTVLSAMAFVLVGIGLKLALFPLHAWLPDAYAHAPPVVTAFLAATATKVALYMLFRLMFGVFALQPGQSDPALWLQGLLVALGLAGVLVCSVKALFQRDLRRLFAWSSVAQVGYMVLGLGIGTGAGIAASLLHVFNHALMKGALFLALAGVAVRLGTPTLDKLDGLGRQMPLTAAALLIGGLSLIGMPLTAGFVSKWYLLLAALDRGWWPVVPVIVVGSLLALVYVGRLLERIYFRPPPASGAVREAPATMLAATWALALANLYFGLDTRYPVSIAERAAQSLLAGGP